MSSGQFNAARDLLIKVMLFWVLFPHPKRSDVIFALQLSFVLSSQVIKHFRPLVSQFLTRTLTALRVFQRRWGSNGLGPGCE